ncbi:bifunctional metallophosphatase/5'-nucleotidase [Idiomarina xiamenensis]|uniref:bifunctional metallophosphatase/5'-nucleotidase n=1 Tax=Idiomarina xiamenensis TaxID=1207041 RepID=UPI0002ED4888|nr:5'-nucleotidase C-terminal domain-containing protein [Idiomarina xiamenensis]
MHSKIRTVALPLLLASSLTLSACSQHASMSAPAAGNDFTLTILHINDHHSHLAAEQALAVQVDDQTYTVESGGFARVISQFKARAAAQPQALKLHAGDAITGSLYYTLYGSAADAKMMNRICFDAFTIGNHEFDDGDAGLKQFIDELHQDACQTPILGANIKPQVGESVLTPKQPWDSFRPYIIKQIDGESVGIIGLTIAKKTKHSSQPDPTTEFADEVATAKRYIAELQQQQVGKIILLTHYGYTNDLALAAELPAVDAIVGGDSHTLLGAYDEFGLSAADDYPVRLRNADGELVCVVQAYQYAQVVGELKLNFVGDQIASCEGKPTFMLGEQLSQNGQAVDAVTQQRVFDKLLASGLFSQVKPDAEAQQALQQLTEQVQQMANRVIAEVPQRICRKSLENAAAAGCGQPRFSDAHRVVAEAFMAAVPDADFAIQNGGGVRSDIAAGEFTVADAYRLLPFANTLYRIDISGAEFKQAMEEALSYAVAANGSPGAYPHGANIQGGRRW